MGPLTRNPTAPLIAPLLATSFAPTPTAADTLGLGRCLDRDQAIRSQAGRFTLTMQSDGYVVVQEDFDDGRMIWASDTDRRGADRLAVQDDGNLAIQTAGIRAVSAAGGIR